MDTVPRDICRKMEDSVQAVRGVAIEHGYTKEILRRIGSVRGCTHLTHLIVAMGPASLHGYWTHRSMEPSPMPEAIDDLPGYAHLVGSCSIWAKDGPFIKEMEEKIASLKKND